MNSIPCFAAFARPLAPLHSLHRFRWATLLLLCSFLWACSKETLQFKAIDITGANYEQAFTPALQMTDTSGKVVTLDQFKGKVVVMFFGFTHCPDACPTTLAEVAQAKTLLGADGAKVQPVFVTLDPERDTTTILQPYVTSFGNDFIALRGNAEHTAVLAKAFKVYYTVVPGKSAGNYTLDHSTGSYVFDPQGRVRLYTRYGAGAQALADDIKLLLDPR